MKSIPLDSMHGTQNLGANSRDEQRIQENYLTSFMRHILTHWFYNSISLELKRYNQHSLDDIYGVLCTKEFSLFSTVESVSEPEFDLERVFSSVF